MERDPTQEEVNDYLNALRDSGRINMWAAPKYIEQDFLVTIEEARKYFTTWTETFEL